MSKESRKLEFIRKAIEKHGDKFDYSEVDYKTSETKVIIICPIHGKFEQIPYSHLNTASGCKKCGIEVRAKKRMDTTESFIAKAMKIHDGKYDYSDTVYVNSHVKVSVICPIHGHFMIKADDHLQGRGCFECGNLKKGQYCKLSSAEFISKAKRKHNNVYSYDNTIYTDNATKVIVTCPIHGDFEVTPNNHLSKRSGCPVCRESKGEQAVREFLEASKIKFTPQKRFPDCKYKYTLPFDFYIPSKNLIIEFDGIQHFEPVDQWGGQEYFDEIQEKDSIKNQYCIDNSIKMCRIPYYELENIDKILQGVL